MFLWLSERCGSHVDTGDCGGYVSLWLPQKAAEETCGRGSMAQEKTARETSVVFVGNQKGGVGKTTNTLNIAAGLAERGKRCLIIDCDMTGGATKALGVPMAGWHNTFDLITRAAPALECVITESDEDDIRLPVGIHLVPATKQLGDLQAWLLQPEARWLVHQDLLLEPIADLRGRYDYVFLDTPPQVTTATLPALKAADFAILSTFPEQASTEQIGEALRDIQNCKRGANPNLEVLGIVVCAMPNPKTVLARQLLKYLGQAKDPEGRLLKFQTDISRTNAVMEARATKQTLFGYAPDHKVTDQYRQLAKEVEARVAVLRAPVSTGTPEATRSVPVAPPVTDDLPAEERVAEEGSVQPAPIERGAAANG